MDVHVSHIELKGLLDQPEFRRFIYRLLDGLDFFNSPMTSDPATTAHAVGLQDAARVILRNLCEIDPDAMASILMERENVQVQDAEPDLGSE